MHVSFERLVQGVFFRDSCRREAQARSLAGWVRNTRSGTVEAEFEGDDADVDALVRWCRSGPPHASVQRVDATAIPTTGDTRFEVR